MNKGLKALKQYRGQQTGVNVYADELLDIIEKELEEKEKIKARLTVINMKLASKRKECVENMEHTDEDDFVHEASKIEMECIDWFRQLLKEVLL